MNLAAVSVKWPILIQQVLKVEDYLGDYLALKSSRDQVCGIFKISGPFRGFVDFLYFMYICEAVRATVILWAWLWTIKNG